MIRVLSAIVLAFLVGNVALTQTPTISAERSLARLVIEDPSGTYRCSGSFIGNDMLLTAAHCILDEVFVLRGKQEEPERLRALWVDRDHDVAILAAANVDTMRLRCSIPAVGQHVEGVGNPFSYQRVHTFGRIASQPMKIPGRNGPRWEVGQLVDAIIGPGMSGGMALDIYGRQIGLLVGGHGDFGIIVPMATVCNLMVKNGTPPPI